MLPGNAVRRQRPALATQLVGDRRMTAERADAGIEGFRRRLSNIPVWNQRQSVGSSTTVSIQLASQQTVFPLKYPTEQAKGAILPANSLHAAEQYNSDARRAEWHTAC
jgi:hypothetical protein